jgi:sulfite exporter TauE/SafE/copper chaperone CopZ
MADTIKTERLRIGGMSCMSCQARIENALRGTDGVAEARASYSGGYAEVRYDTRVITSAAVRAVIERLDYAVLPERAALSARGAPNARLMRAAGLALITVSLYLLISRLNLLGALPLAEAGMSYGMLFLIGLLTSVHCAAMCGGINLSQCIPQTGGSPLRSSLLYNLGRVASYTVIGGIVGALGRVMTFSGALRGAMQLLAGAFMIVMGVNMLGIFPWLRKLQPRLPGALSGRIARQKGKSGSPLIVGLLNGLMPCGPLQAMQLYALSTGSPLEGALSMLLFSLGTAPLMFGLGALSALLSKRFTGRILTAGAVLVTVLGLTMFTQGASLSGLSFGNAANARGGAETYALDGTIVDGVQLVASTLEPGGYPKITVQAELPVRWTIDAPKGTINGCNNRMLIPAFGIEYQFQAGENVIEFTPAEAGRFSYGCWMGMIRSVITVVEAEGRPGPDDSGL